MNGDDILDVDAASALLRADSETVLRFARSGELPGTRIGKSWVFLREDLIAFLKSQISKDTEARRNKPRSSPASAVLTPVSPNKRRKPLPALPALPSPPPGS